MTTPADPLVFLTHTMRYIINHQPVALSDCTQADDAMDIITRCKEWIRAEHFLSTYGKVTK
jgi:hypothetical protein